MWVSKAEWNELYDKCGGHGNRIFKLETKFAGDMQTEILKDRVKALEDKFDKMIKEFKETGDAVLKHEKERTELAEENNTAQAAHLERHERHSAQVEKFLESIQNLIKNFWGEK